MNFPKLQDQIFVLTSLIRTMDNLYDLGMKDAIPLEELQTIYSRIKVLKGARSKLLKKRKKVTHDILHCPSYWHLLQAAKERILN